MSDCCGSKRNLVCDYQLPKVGSRGSRFELQTFTCALLFFAPVFIIDFMCRASRLRGIPKTVQAALVEKLCGDMKFAGSHMPRYRAAHRKWLAIMRTFSEWGVVVQKKSIDEALLDLTTAARQRILCSASQHSPASSEVRNAMKVAVEVQDQSKMTHRLKERQRKATAAISKSAAVHGSSYIDEQLGTLAGRTIKVFTICLTYWICVFQWPVMPAAVMILSPPGAGLEHQ